MAARVAQVMGLPWAFQHVHLGGPHSCLVYASGCRVHTGSALIHAAKQCPAWL